MAPPPILTLSGIALGFGGRPLFAGVTLAIAPGERLCLVGRNGSGKSTLLRLMAGLAEPDAGERFLQPGRTVAYLPQDPDPTGHATLLDYAAAELGPDGRWRAESALDALEVAPGTDPATASGGERRRAALARLIAAEADLMLLDEPTNHLDIRAIEWLEEHLDATSAAFALVSHDRAFLTRLSRATLWIDRGEVRRAPMGFAGFEEWREKVWQEEDAQSRKLDRLIRAEAHWATYGISARRTRNQGRLRRLAALRAERAEQIRRAGTAAMALEGAERSGKLVVEARGIAKSWGDRRIVRDFSLRIGRGERVAIVGANGVGKTTLLNMLIGREKPDAGTVRLGANLQLAVFDQARAQLDGEKSLWETLTDDRELGGQGRARGDQVMVRGQPRHVVAYLKDFLFDERQACGPVKALSGGERARLLLARIMARPANLLVLDEPTNDLDIETLDLLQELVADFDGTVLLVSHDRDFLDRVATTTVAMEGDGRATVYAGGWSDYRAQRAGRESGQASAQESGRRAPKPARKPAPEPAPEPARQARSAIRAEKLTFTQRHRLEALPAEIERLGAEIGKLEALLADPELYARDPARFEKATKALAERQSRLDAAETEWLELESLRE